MSSSFETKNQVFTVNVDCCWGGLRIIPFSIRIAAIGIRSLITQITI